MELRHLRYFVAVAEEGSLTNAAERRRHTAQPSLSRQIRDLESRGAQLYDCEYGPTNPDSTGSETVTFWYKDVPIPMADFLKVSRKHPLGKFGDQAVTACPVTLADARQTFTKSRQVGLNRVDQSALPPAEVPLDRVMGTLYPVYLNTKKSWSSYQVTHDPRDQQQAITGKKQLLSVYEQACDRMKAAGQPPTMLTARSRNNWVMSSATFHIAPGHQTSRLSHRRRQQAAEGQGCR